MEVSLGSTTDDVGSCRRSNRVRKLRRPEPSVTGVTMQRNRMKRGRKSSPRKPDRLNAPRSMTCNWKPNYESRDVGTATALPSNVERREAYLLESKAYATTLARTCGDADAERLYCPVYKRNGCACIQRYVESDGLRQSESVERVNGLLRLIKEAKRLGCQKCYDVTDSRTVSRRHRNIGLGNGQKKSKAFEDFVLENRDWLRHELHFCERAAQKILVYSNNFLHKRLKTVPGTMARVKRRKGRAVLGLLPPIERLPSERCCSSDCVSLATTHTRLVREWRQRVTSGQAEARRVLAEMLTPSGGTRTNCYNFISMVTGCSNSTISKVSEQMRTTGGDREPPEHGLKRWHKTNERSKAATDDAPSLELTSHQFASAANLLFNIPCLDGACVTFNVPLADPSTLPHFASSSSSSPSVNITIVPQKDGDDHRLVEETGLASEVATDDARPFLVDVLPHRCRIDLDPVASLVDERRIFNDEKNAIKSNSTFDVEASQSLEMGDISYCID